MLEIYESHSFLIPLDSVLFIKKACTVEGELAFIVVVQDGTETDPETGRYINAPIITNNVGEADHFLRVYRHYISGGKTPITLNEEPEEPAPVEVKKEGNLIHFPSPQTDTIQ